MNYIAKSDNRIVEIPTIKIRPNKTQPRKIFDDEQLRDLANSIAENGILQPLTVRRVSQSEYEIIAGERRLRASVIAGYSKVPCIVVKCNDRESAMLALVENLQRCDLGIFEEARGISRLLRDVHRRTSSAAGGVRSSVHRVLLHRVGHTSSSGD